VAYVSAAAMNAECSVCRQVKAGPVPIQPSSGGGATGGVIVRAGDPPTGPFVCFDCLSGRARAWTITAAAHRELPIEDRHRFAYELSRGDAVRRIVVEFTGTVASCDPAGLPSPLGAAVETHGRSIVEAGPSLQSTSWSPPIGSPSPRGRGSSRRATASSFWCRNTGARVCSCARAIRMRRNGWTTRGRRPASGAGM
jgi:hypothetical protein